MVGYLYSTENSVLGLSFFGDFDQEELLCPGSSAPEILFCCTWN
jgi:hypothetical protein